MEDSSGCDALKIFYGRRERMEGWMKGRKDNIIKSLAVIKSFSSIVSDNIKLKDSKGYHVETSLEDSGI